MDSSDDIPREPLGDIVARFEGPLVRYAARITGDAERARDVVQETFLAWHQESTAAQNGHLPQWLFTVCRRKALDVRRKEQRMTLLSAEQAQVALGQLDAAPPVECQEQHGQLLRLLERLSSNQQEVVRLKFQAGLSYREIAAVTGLSVSNVGFLLHVALKRLKEWAGEGGG